MSFQKMHVMNPMKELLPCLPKMKGILLILFVLLNLDLFGQRAGIFFYDSDWNLTTRDRAVYFRTCRIDTSSTTFFGEVKDFYKNGQPQMKGYYVNNVKVDSFYFYYPNGNLESKGLYVNDLRMGIWKYYYKNAQLKQVVDFFANDFVVKEYYDSLGTPLLPNGTGKWGNTFRLHNQNSWVRVEGPYKKGLKHGKWKVYIKYGDGGEKLDNQNVFKKDKLKSPWYAGSFLSSYFQDKYKLKMTEEFKYSVYVSKKDYPYINKLPEAIDSLDLPYDRNASFPGGENALYSFLSKKLRYPELARGEGKEGVELVEFIVDKNGQVAQVESPEPTRDMPAYGFREEAMRVIKLLPQWEPAVRDNKPVPQKQVIFIHFSIEKMEVQRGGPSVNKTTSGSRAYQ